MVGLRGEGMAVLANDGFVDTELLLPSDANLVAAAIVPVLLSWIGSGIIR